MRKKGTAMENDTAESARDLATVQELTEEVVDGLRGMWSIWVVGE